MSDVKRLPIAPRIEAAAAAWVARRDSGPLDDASQAEFEAWLAASPAHREAFDLYDGLWGDLDELSSRPSGVAPLEPANDRAGFPISRRALAAAAGLVLIVGTSLIGFELLQSPESAIYATAVGEQRTVTLADNSRVTLNTDTSLREEFSDHVRRIRLDRGEALFEVSHDAARPFIVVSPAGTVRAVGTKFVVRVGDDGQLDVLVTEGRVIVSRTGGGSTGHARATAPSPAPVSAGQELQVSDGHLAVASVTLDELNRELAWRQGDIVFSGEPLSQAVAEMQRYTKTRISVDPAVAHYSVGGYFRTNDVEAFLETVQTVFPVQAIRSQGEVRLVARRS